MQKTILLTGSTDGIGLATAKMLVSLGHHVLLHGRSPAKLESAVKEIYGEADSGKAETYVADLSRQDDVKALAQAVTEKHSKIDVLINNAGILKTPSPITEDGMDVRFVVNTVAPYLLAQKLMPLLDSTGRIVNLSSAAQAPVDLQALAGEVRIDDDFGAYAQSKLALTMWSRQQALALGDGGPVIVAVNPGSLLASKMVKDAFGIPGGDLNKGAKILTCAALDDEFESASGKYFDNDSGQFADPHPDALDSQKCDAVVGVIEAILAQHFQL